MYIGFEKVNDILVIKMQGELDHHSAEEIRNKVDDRIDRDDIKKVVVEFSNVSFMDSSGIGVVIGRYKKLLSKGGNISVVNPRGNVRKVFELSGMFKIIPEFNTLEAAISGM